MTPEVGDGRFIPECEHAHWHRSMTRSGQMPSLARQPRLTETATSTTALSSSRIALPRWLSGVNWRHETCVALHFRDWFVLYRHPIQAILSLGQPMVRWFWQVRMHKFLFASENQRPRFTFVQLRFCSYATDFIMVESRIRQCM